MTDGSASGIEVVGVTKDFGSFRALDDVSFSARRGEITGLIGENGAGKTTLVRIVAGLERAEGGTIVIDGEPLEPASPVASIRRGVAMVHQHFMLFDDLSVAENIIFGAEPTRSGRLDMAAAEEEITSLMQWSGLSLPLSRTIAELNVAQRQRVELLKVLYRGGELLLLDEPTSVLTPQETDELFEVLDDLRRRGHAIVLITHRLREVVDFTDRVSVLRAGRSVATAPIGETDAGTLAELMVGRTPHLRSPSAAPRDPLPVLEVRGVTTDGDGSDSLDDITFTVGAGELVGVAGVTGNGQAHLAEVLLGLRAASAGQVTIGGRDVTEMSTVERRELGLSYIPGDRFARGLAAGESVVDNASVGHLDEAGLTRGALLAPSAMRAWARTVVDRYDIRGQATRADDLSGGNAQKLVFGRELERRGDLVIAEQPTRGVDVGAIEQLHARLEERRAEGSAVLLISADLDELLQLSQRILVMYRGRIVAELPMNSDRYLVGRHMAGLGATNEATGEAAT